MFYKLLMSCHIIDYCLSLLGSEIRRNHLHPHTTYTYPIHVPAGIPYTGVYRVHVSAPDMPQVQKLCMQWQIIDGALPRWKPVAPECEGSIAFRGSSVGDVCCAGVSNVSSYV